MAVCFTPIAVEEVRAHVGHVGPAPKVVMSHQAVEVHGRRRADSRGQIRDLGNGVKVCLDLTHHGVRRLQRSAFRHVDDDLKFVLVVEREHFEGHQSGQGEYNGNDEQDRYDPQQHHASPP